LLNNVVFGLPEDQIDLSAVERAITAAQLDTFVKTLPQGLQTHIGENGVKLSGGQRQRIGIARALYSDPEILVFDEATSALDSTTEQQVMNAIQELRKNKTILIVAHRLSTVFDCDNVYQIENGKLMLVENLSQKLALANTMRDDN
jgi:ATP-binding cassette, subfamily B, bacterial PglK